MKKAASVSAVMLGMAVATAPLAYAGTSATPTTDTMKQESAAAATWMQKNALSKQHEWTEVARFAGLGTFQSSTWSAAELAKITASTDAARVILGLLAAGLDPHNYMGKNWVDALTKAQLTSGDNTGEFADNLNRTGTDLINAQAWAIIALEDAGHVSYQRSAAAEWLIAQQNKDGGFGSSKSYADSDPDDTAAAIVALSLLGYSKDSAPVSKAITYLQAQQVEDGSIAYGSTTGNADSTGAVVDALAGAGVNPVSWTKQSGNLASGLNQFYDAASGGFKFDNSEQSWSGVGWMSTRDGLIGLGALQTGKSVYQRLHWTGLGWLNSYWAHVQKSDGAWSNHHWLTWNQLRPMAVAGSYVSHLTPAWQAVVKAHGKYVKSGTKTVWEAWDPTLANQALKDSFGLDSLHLNGLA